jgi:hypothetical protein
MRTEVLEGNRDQILRQVTKVRGNVVGAVVFVDDPADQAATPNDLSDFQDELDALMALGSANTTPADVSREAIYSPEQE